MKEIMYESLGTVRERERKRKKKTYTLMKKSA